MDNKESDFVKNDPEVQAQLKVYLERWQHLKGNLIPILHDIQKDLGYVPREWSMELAKTLGISLAQIYEVLTFYNYFKLKPQGKNRIQVCLGTACHVKGAPIILEAIKKHLGIQNEGEATADRLFQLDVVRCIGACGLAPAVTVNDEVIGKCTPEKVIERIEALKKNG